MQHVLGVLECCTHNLSTVGYKVTEIDNQILIGLITITAQYFLIYFETLQGLFIMLTIPTNNHELYLINNFSLTLCVS